jgi:hypothetical protein
MIFMVVFHSSLMDKADRYPTARRQQAGPVREGFYTPNRID